MAWYDRILGTVPQAEPQTLANLPPELQNSHGGSLASGVINGLGSLVTYGRDAYEGTIDPRSEAGIERAFDGAGSLGFSARAGLAAAPQMVPEGALGIFAGRKARTANLDNLAAAEKLVGEGADPARVWNDTGWFQGGDGKWRFEIDDSPSKIGNKAAEGFIDGEPLRGRIARNLTHDDLYAAHPELRNLDVQIERGGDYRQPWAGTYDGRTIGGNAASTKDARELMLHEGQHAVQEIEGFARGGSPERMAALIQEPQAVNDARVLQTLINRGASPEDAPAVFLNMMGRDAHPSGRILAQEMTPDELHALPIDARDAYRRLPGEVEARNVERRKDMTPEQRRAAPPWTTEDVPRNRQLNEF